MTEFTRNLSISGAYDGRDHPRNYGIGAMKLYFSVKGPKGGTSCMFGTSWYLSQNQQISYEMLTEYPLEPLKELMQPKPWDVSYHTSEPQFEGHSGRDDCELVEGTCYSDGSALWGDKWLPVLLHEGSEGIFKRLEAYYEERFNNGPVVDLTPVPRKFKD